MNVDHFPSVSYDDLGNPRLTQFSTGEQVEYVYTPSGQKVREIHRSPKGLAIGGTLPSPHEMTADTTNYIGPAIYRGGRPEMVRYAGGFASLSRSGTSYVPAFYHYITDYLGNNRAVVRASTGAMEQITHYYPWGSVYGDMGAGAALQPYKYGDKELDLTAGVARYDYAARAYFPAIPRFDRPDALAGKYPHISPYAFCANNPVNFTDPTGLEITQEIDGQLYFYKKVDDQWGFYDFRNNLYTGNKSFAGDIDKIREADPILDRMITYIAENEMEVRLFYGDENGSGLKPDSQGGTAYFSIYYNPERTEGGKAIQPDGTATLTRTPETGLAHEFGHIYEWMHPDTYSVKQWHPTLLFNIDPVGQKEIISCITENIYREATGQPLRISYTYNGSEIRYSIMDKMFMNNLTIKH